MTFSIPGDKLWRLNCHARLSPRSLARSFVYVVSTWFRISFAKQKTFSKMRKNCSWFNFYFFFRLFKRTMFMLVPFHYWHFCYARCPLCEIEERNTNTHTHSLDRNFEWERDTHTLCSDERQNSHQFDVNWSFRTNAQNIYYLKSRLFRFGCVLLIYIHTLCERSAKKTILCTLDTVCI